MHGGGHRDADGRRADLARASAMGRVEALAEARWRRLQAGRGGHTGAAQSLLVAEDSVLEGALPLVGCVAQLGEPHDLRRRWTRMETETRMA